MELSKKKAIKIAIKKEKFGINFSKQNQIATNILDLSKALMQDFYHNCIKNK